MQYGTVSCLPGRQNWSYYFVVVVSSPIQFERERVLAIFPASPRLAASVRILTLDFQRQLANVLLLEDCCCVIEQTCNASSPSAKVCLPLLWSAVEEQTKGCPQIQMRVLRCHKFPRRGRFA
jgi:hypothetical protein